MSPRLRQALDAYARDVARLAGADTSTEPSYYPAIKAVLDAALADLELHLEVRASTSEARRGGGRDAPDFAIYDGAGGFVMLYVEAKSVGADIRELAHSADQHDQIGRYLAATGAVLLCTVREFAVVTADGQYGGVAVAPERRHLSPVVDLWSSERQLRAGARITEESGAELLELIENVLTRHTPIASPETLARVLARQARRAVADLPTQFSDAVGQLREDFAAALGISFDGDQGEHFFRSSLIQTVFYGLFAGWLLHASEWRLTPDDDYDWERTGEYLRIPFLADLFYEIRSPRRVRELGLRQHLEIAAATLGRVDRRQFFQRLELNEDEQFTSAILYFYEPFLAAFDPMLRADLGVWYTPPEIVRYQVRQVDRLLREELGFSRGLADERVTVVDPACGTGAYLIETLRCIAETLREDGVGAELAATLRAAAQQRVYGFEILTAPFVVSHLQLYLLLARLGAPPDETHRAGVFLTNALSGWSETARTMLHFPSMQEERDAAQRVKREARVVVVLGNPPYNRFAGPPDREEEALVDAYKGIRRDDTGRQIGQSQLWSRWGVRKQLLDDLYVRFYRLAEEWIGLRAEFGVVSFISNSSFLSGRSHPIMRESLLGSFDAVWIDNLNGDKYKGQSIPDGMPGAGGADASIFTVNHKGGIQVGTCITTWVKREHHQRDPTRCETYIRDFWGTPEHKRQALLDSIEIQTWSPAARRAAEQRAEGPRPYVRFQTDADRRWKLLPYEIPGGYEEWPSIDQLFGTSSPGVNPNRGISESVIDTDRSALETRMRDYFSQLSDEAMYDRYPKLMTPRARYDAAGTRRALADIGFEPQRIAPYLIFPLDLRFLYYETRHKLLNEGRDELRGALGDGNEFLVVVHERRQASETKPLLARCAFDLHLFDVGAQGFFADKRVRIEQALDQGEPAYVRVANLSSAAWEGLAQRWAFKGDVGGVDATQLVRDLFRLALAVGHSPAFQRDFAGSLAHDWLHLPIPRDHDVLTVASGIGDQVAVLLDPLAPVASLRAIIDRVIGREAARLGVLTTLDGRPATEDDLRVQIAYSGSAPGRWRPRAPAADEPWREQWGDRTGDLFLNDRVFLKHVPERVWRHELGGYPVIKKWLGYRQARSRSGRPLTLSEKDHVRTMIQRLAALLVLEPKLDDLYSQLSGFAFTAAELGLETQHD